MKIARRRRLATIPVVLAIVSGLSLSAAASPSDDKRAEAAQIAKKREALIQRAERLNEQSKATKLELDLVSAEVKVTEAAVSAQSETVSAINRNVVDVALNSYIYGEQSMLTDLVDSFNGSGPSVSAAREGYASMLVGSASDKVDELRAVRQDTERLGKELSSKQERLTTLGTQLQNETLAITKVQAELATLALKVNGELVQLVADEARRREEAEAARARADAERQRQELARIAEKQSRELARVAAQERQDLAAKRAADTARTNAARVKTVSTQPRTIAAATPIIAAPRQGVAQAPIVDDVPRPPAPNPGAAIAIAEALRQLGKPYVFGTNGPDTFDCSGLTQWAWAKAGVSMDHYTGSQASAFPRVDPDQLQPGDLVFFNVDLGHMGMYIGNDQIVQAPRTGDVVKISSLNRGNVVVAVRPG
jgi:cell wall-associated NlpC family hydrolase